MMSDDANGEKVPSVYSRLAARFPAAAHKTKTIGGTGLTYVDGETVISRLNEELGLDGWSFEVKSVTVLEDEVWAQGRLTVYLGERMIVREQAGGQIINRKRGIPATPARPAQDADGDRPSIPAVAAQPAVKGEPIELSNDIKGAITDCLKKCATLAGVGLYLYDPQERREVEAEMKGGARQQSAPSPRPRSDPPKPVSAPIEPEGDAPFKYANVQARYKAAAEYARLVRFAVETGYQHAEKVRGKQAKDLSDSELEGSIRVLRKWELSQSPEQGVAS